MTVAADALGLVRLLVAAALPGALGRGLALADGAWVPLALVVLAAATDFFDGRLARRASRPSRHGALLDNGADLALVLAGTGAGAAHGLVPWAAPGAILLAFGVYVVASARRSARQAAWQPARSRTGHMAGVLNYALVALIAGAVALPSAAWGPGLRAASLVVVGVNLAAVLERATVGRRRPVAYGTSA